MNLHVRRALAASATAALGLGAALAVAAPASADDWDISTPAIQWYDAEDTALSLSEAEANYPDLFGSGVDVQGWTDDALDGFFYDFGLSHDGEVLKHRREGRHVLEGLLAGGRRRHQGG